MSLQAGTLTASGMLIACVIKNVGVDDAIAWVRSVKSKYVETREQEEFVLSLPLVLDENIAKKYPSM